MQPATVLIWATGLIWLLRAKPWRWIGLTYLFFLVLMMALHAKDYYVAPIYPILFAAGGIAWERRFARRPAVVADRIFAFPIFQTIILVACILILPMSLPLMTPQRWLAYTKATHLYKASSNTETMSSGSLPQFYADRFGWQEEVDQVTRIFHSLPPDQQRTTGIYCSDYGEGSALNFLGQDLPFAISGHNNYYLWGSHGYTGDSLIVINGATPAEMHDYYTSVETVGHMGTTYSMPFEHRNIYLARGRQFNLTTSWPDMKFYF